MIKTVLYLPERDHTGRPFPMARWQALEARLLDLGGFTRAEDVRGAWRDQAGRTYRERNRQYVVWLES